MTMHNTKYLVKRNTSCYNHVKMLGAKIYGFHKCYVKIGGDYNDILHRFMNENMVRKFVLKFPQDNNMALFEESWAKKDYETAFRAMHTLKGVAVNLGFTALYNVSSALTEKLRSQEYDNLDGLIADVKKQYDIVIEAIAALG